MRSELQPRRGLFGIAFAAAVIALMGYLGFAGLQGEHGLLRLLQIEAEETRLAAELEALRAERAAIVNKTERLSTGSIDIDLLDERARKVLGLGRRDEIILPERRRADTAPALGDSGLTLAPTLAII